MGLFKKISPRRTQVRRNIPSDRFSWTARLVRTDTLISLLIWALFVVLCAAVLAFDALRQERYLDAAMMSILTGLIGIAPAIYIKRYQKRIVRNHTRAIALAGTYILLLISTKAILSLLGGYTWLATAGVVVVAIILAIAYDHRFALGMSLYFCLLVCLAVGDNPADEYQLTNINLFLTLVVSVMACNFSLKDLRTRVKLLQVSTITAVAVFIAALSLGLLRSQDHSAGVFKNAGLHAGVTLATGVLIQGLLPLIEKAFRIATSMTLLDYSDANQPLLKRLHMEAPGTFSHSLLIGSIAEAAGQAIGRNGLLCRVGAYYHDIGKINKPGYFVENEMGSANRHKELSPAMSHLIIIGHVKDGMELAKEYGLPGVLRQFIETHHGTTLIEHFYHEAKKQTAQNPKAGSEPAESEFRYPGPRPKTKEAAIVMLSDSVEGAVRSLPEITPIRIEAVVRNMAMKRLQDGQFDECDLTLRELSRIEASISKTLAAHYHNRIAYPHPPDQPEPISSRLVQSGHHTK